MMKNYIALGTAVMTLSGTPLSAGKLTECLRMKSFDAAMEARAVAAGCKNYTTALSDEVINYCQPVIQEGTNALLEKIQQMKAEFMGYNLEYFKGFVAIADTLGITTLDATNAAMQYYNNQYQKLLLVTQEFAEADSDMQVLLGQIGLGMVFSQEQMDTMSPEEICDTMHTNMLAAYEMLEQYLNGASLDILFKAVEEAVGNNGEESVQNDDSGVDAEEIST